MSMRSTLRFLAALHATNLKAWFALRGAFWTQVVAMALNDFIFFAIWAIFFRRYESVAGWRLPDMAALYGMIAGSYGIAAVLAGGASRLSQSVLEGRLEVVLVQPKDPLLHIVSSRMRASGIGDVVAGIVLLSLSGLVRLETVPLALTGLVAGALVLAATMVLFHSLVFFLGPVSPLAQQLSEFLVTFSTYPDAIAGGLLRVVLFTALPAAFVAWFPVSLVRDFGWGGLAATVGGAAGYVVLAVLVFRAGLRRYESSGRFGAGL
jgi:ABC-2 type transport system permease protein